MTTRREILAAAGAAAACMSLKPAFAQMAVRPLANLGGAPAGFPIRTRAGRGGPKPFDFVEHCHNLGLRRGRNPAQGHGSGSHQDTESEGGRLQMRAIGSAAAADEAGVPHSSA